MASDRLRVLLAMRRRQVEQARQVLAACLKVEADAAAVITAIDAATRRDREAMRTPETSYLFLEMFVRRTDAMQAERGNAVSALVAAQTHSAAAVAEVVAARTAAEAVDTLITERAAVAAAEIDRRAQHVLDDIARMQFIAARTED